MPPAADGAAALARGLRARARERTCAGCRGRRARRALSAPGKPVRRADDASEDIADTIDAFAERGRGRRATRLRRRRDPRRARLPDRPVLLGRHQPAQRRLRRGDLGERARFAAEIVARCARPSAPDFPDHPALLAVEAAGLRREARRRRRRSWRSGSAPLADAGVDIFHCSQRRFWEPEFEGSDLNFAGWAKKLTGKPTITVGSVGLDGDFISAFGGKSSAPASLDESEARLERGEFDLVAVGRALLTDRRVGSEGARRPARRAARLRAQGARPAHVARRGRAPRRTFESR